MKFLKKKELEQKRHWRVRSKVCGSAERPRLSLCLSNKHIYAQCINDHEGKTIVSLCSTSKELAGEKLKAAGVTAVVFDRGSRRYHGCVKSFADAVRAAGINF